MKKTKIVATIGPASNNYDTLVRMVKSGMNVARINFSHGTLDQHKSTIDLLKKVRKDMNVPLGIMLDTKGPELRFRDFEGGSVELKKGDTFVLTTEDVIGDNTRASINHPETIDLLEVGDKILACNALVSLKVVAKLSNGVECKVVDGGVVGSHKSLAFPGKKFNFPYLSDDDKRDIEFGIRNDVDFVACSFVNSAEDVLAVRKLIGKCGGDVAIISKIESELGINNLDDIIEVSDGIMVARGDLGVELPFEQIPHLQKTIISKCLKHNKIVITATEMLESMISSARPTRAEASDVANAVFDGSSAVMLSGESAMGKYPVQAVSTMARIIEETEKYVNYADLHDDNETKSNDLPDVMAGVVASITFKLSEIKVTAIYTETGHTAMMISKQFSTCPIVALTPNPKTYQRISAVWGIYPILTKKIKTADKLIEEADKIVRQYDFAKDGDLILIGTGTRNPGNTDIIKLHYVGD